MRIFEAVKDVFSGIAAFVLIDIPEARKAIFTDLMCFVCVVKAFSKSWIRIEVDAQHGSVSNGTKDGSKNVGPQTVNDCARIRSNTTEWNERL